MTFTRRYLLSLFVLPALVGLPMALIFLAQVVQFSAWTALSAAGLLIVFYASAAFATSLMISPTTAAVEKALEEGGDVGAAASVCLRRTNLASWIVWPVAGYLFALLGMFLIMRTVLGFSYFAVAAMVAAFPAIAWSYVSAKTRLLEAGSGASSLRYSGPTFPLGRKIAIVFIGFFLIAAAMLVELISSKVSTTLEILAIQSSADRYQHLFETASATPPATGAALETLREDLPRDYEIRRILPDGTHISTQNDSLTEDEVSAILRLRNGDSSAYISPHVSRFRELPDRSILILTIPWTPYRNIPRQIAFYTTVVALLTMAIFSVATYFLARDISTPLRELRELSRAMAEGNFDARAQVFADDEIGQLAESFAETRANLRRLLGRLGGSGSTITEGVRVITGGTESLLNRSRDQSELTESSSLAVENVRGGISSVLAAADTVTELTQDASSRALELQASAEEVARSMDYLFQSVEKTSSSTTQMNASMTEMSRRTEVLAGIGDEVVSFVSQMDSTIEELRAGSQATAQISRQVREDAEAGGGAVNRTVEGINVSRDLTNQTADVIDELQTSVGQIGQIVNVIEEVTNRTNLLALNAAIIAAQAGEQGLGFTVVAEEIRELAERTRGSTKEIAAIIKAVQAGSRQAVAKMHEGVERVQDNVRLAGEAAQSLAKIVGSATQSYEMATQISQSLDEQAIASRHLHEVTSRMSDHIAEINRATREQARGTELLAQESERVREIAGQVRNATDEQSQAGRGITDALEKIAEDARAMRDLLERQLEETDRIADASRTMLDIAQQNDAVARQFNTTVQNLVRSGQDFEAEVSKFRLTM
ncbi:MAG: methyl-accepting chemotaxis protein [Acidobacteriota bacterium]